MESPLAVRALEINAPTEITGEGTQGSAEFDVTFGYDGEYTATSHGLAVQTDTIGSVDQDPDQNFDPADSSGTTGHQFSVQSSVHFRVSLQTEDLVPDDPAVDLDLYLYDSAGEEVASSTFASSTEQIDASLPADDTYTLYVHGWDTRGGTVEYTLRSWDVPAEAGTGSLQILSAPTEAVRGETGTIEIGWSGLENGEHLGAVSHIGPEGRLGDWWEWRRTNKGLSETACEYRFDVHNRRSIDRLQVAHQNPRPIDGDDLHPVQPDRVGSVLRPGAEHAGLGSERVVAGMDGEDVTPPSMEPSEQEDLIAGS